MRLEPVGVDFLDRAEHVWSTDVDLPATPDEVWDVLADNTSWTEWFAGCRSVESSAPVWTAAGDTRSITVGPMRIEEVAAAVDRPHRWAISLTRTTIPMASRMLEVLDLHDTSRNGEDRTEVRWTGALDVPMYLRPALPILRSQLTKKWGASLEDLHDVVISRRA